MLKTPSLYDNQQNLILNVYKFRFVTAPHIANLKNKHRDTVKRSLETLTKKGLLGKNYPSSFRLANRAAEYYVTKEGIRYLKTVSTYNLSPQTLKSMYKDKNASRSFIEGSLRILDVYTSLKKTYKDINIFTVSEIRSDEVFPTPYPQLYLTGKTQYMLDVFDEKYFFIIKKRINQLTKHSDEVGWEYGGAYPTCLLVVSSEYLKKKTLNYLEDSLADVDFLVTTLEELLHSSAPAIWFGVDEEGVAQVLE